MLFQVFSSFFQIGLFVFGGGTAIIPFLEKEVVDARQWLTFNEMVDIITVSQMTPGPIAINMATFVGYRVAGLAGAAVATGALILPALIIMTVLFYTFKRWHSLPAFNGILTGIRAVIVAFILVAAWKVASATSVQWLDAAIFLASLAALTRLRWHPLWVLFAAAGGGILLYGWP